MKSSDTGYKMSMFKLINKWKVKMNKWKSKIYGICNYKHEYIFRSRKESVLEFPEKQNQ